MKEQIETIIKSVCRDLFHIETSVELTRPAIEFGDFSTNIALKLSKQLEKSATEIAETMTEIINNQDSKVIDKVSMAGPGFINITLTAQALHYSYSNATKLEKSLKGKQILVEFGDPNPFKEMHLGHFYNAIEGDIIANLLAADGADIERLSYHGDVGPQVAKCIWGIGSSIDWNLDKLDEALKSQPLGSYYAKGAEAYEKDEQVKKRINEINEHIYKKDDDVINQIYRAGWDISFKQFDYIFNQAGIKHNKRYQESASADIGVEVVEKNVGSVFEESEGAIVFKGEKVGLHTRVFINSRGLPTYETKDLGLAILKDKDFPKADRSIVITANEQAEYFKVMLAALAEINPQLSTKTIHLTHGFLTLTTGKMSSRTGDVYEAKTLIDDVKAAVKELYPRSTVQKDVFLAAIRYTFLRQRLGADIIFDIKDSVSLEGNSGPYIQYAHARARSILNKAHESGKDIATELKIDQIPLETSERYLAMKISQFPEIFERAANEYMPHHICTYLYELAQEFNSFYESNRVINDSRMFTRLHLVNIYAEVLKTGLQLLNIPAPVQM